MKSHLRAPHLARHTSININPSATSSTSSTLHMRPTNGTPTPSKTSSSHHQVSDPISCFGVPVFVFCTNQNPLFYSFGKCTKTADDALHHFALIFHLFSHGNSPPSPLVEVFYPPHARTITTIIAGSYPPWKSYRLQGFFPFRKYLRLLPSCSNILQPRATESPSSIFSHRSPTCVC